MSYDGLVMKSVKEELQEHILGGRVDRIYQQDNNEITLNIRNKGNNYKLLISASGNNPRVYLTKYSKENPQTPPAFCMLLRKHLEGARIIDIMQFKMDRIMSINFQSKNELGDDLTKSLVMEIMGKHSNVILINQSTSKIIDSLKRINKNISSLREVLPGMTYSPLPISTKVNPLTVSKEDFMNLISSGEQRLTLKKYLVQSFTGISPLISAEIIFRSGLDDSRPIISIDSNEKNVLWDNFQAFFNEITRNNFNPTIILNEDKSIKAFSAVDLRQFSDKDNETIDSISDLLDKVYLETDISDRIKQKSQHLRKVVKNNLDKFLLKQEKLTEELNEAIDREKYKVYADLISANIYSIEKGSKKVELTNFYSPDSEIISVPLDFKLSPIQNAQKYYKKYSKLKNAAKIVKIQLEENSKNIEYLNSVMYNIDSSTSVEDIEDIKIELIEENYIKQTKLLKSKDKKKKVSNYETFLTSEGFTIHLGKNNKQNDKLTLKDAQKDDLWFHVKNAPGSHVVLKKEDTSFTDNSIILAANLAAIYSALSSSQNIEVDYTERKNIKRHPSKKPGLVNYTNYKTVNIKPDKDLYNTLIKNEKK